MTASILQFDSAEAMLAHIHKQRAAADAAVTPKQQAIKVGDCFARYAEEAEVVVYGEVLDPTPSDDADMSEEERAYEAELFQQPHMTHIRFCRCYSVADPLCATEGELGDVHVASMEVLLPRALFDLAREAGWPNDPTGRVLALLAAANGLKERPILLTERDA